ncbi:MAG: polyprenyl diphosphate synthase, partial [Patescibacteria group bacterium]
MKERIGKELKSIAVIMDGNRRWARSKGLDDLEGHVEGYGNLLNFLDWIIEAEVPYLTVFAFSSENWKRSKKEVDHLQSLIQRLGSDEKGDLIKKGVRARMIGRKEDFPKETQVKLAEMEKATEKCKKLKLNIALSYGGRGEIVSAAREWSHSGEKDDEESFSSFLQTSGTPDPDIVIRTGGERRVSNFLLWQIAYSELFFTNTFWPDFS